MSINASIVLKWRSTIMWRAQHCQKQYSCLHKVMLS